MTMVPSGLDEDALRPADVHDITEEGSDMTRDIFFAILKETQDNPSRPKSLPDQSEILHKTIGKASDIAQPGGFRRDHVITNMRGNSPHVPPYVQDSFLDSIQPTPGILQSAYGDFIVANLGLADDDDDLAESATPLLRRSWKRIPEKQQRGATIGKTVFTILKSFIGSGILFLPKGFENGGMLFSLAALCISAVLSTFCMLRLAKCSNMLLQNGRSNVSYGLIGEKACGKLGRIAVNISLVLSQTGFCCSYLIFVEKNIGEVILAAFGIQRTIASSSLTLIMLQILLYTPLSWVRRIEYFALTNLFADLLILFGIVYILSYTIQMLKEAKVGSVTCTNFNSTSWALLLGTAVYCFEGIGLVLPIYDAMDDDIKQKFPRILSYTMLFLVMLFSVFAGLVYAAFGENTQSVVTLNLPSAQDSIATMSVQITYSLALILTYPLMLYPVVKILECYIFPYHSRKGYWRWEKNGFRFALVCLTAAIAYYGKEELDNFVALIVGILIMIFATYQAASTWK
ncbi:vacuolar amino acid [Plasmopara halstedii]|uniref:Vacuolar amino acid n=1 Tax=Plasmopara halstedii TaxID=4781 RepID=A0A0P1AN01_PLAHL|nr:vacuolar amino acid [Plasmopara halstedii]CEG42418.1 vacuolar amino acid [Plasmopara halstedii]|eukprot:XP_024578787.1 vacuolar amino acid [Plasmopara halstedii]